MSTTTKVYLKLLSKLTNENVPHDIVIQLMTYVKGIYRSELEYRYSEPMKIIGMYIAVASLVCILAMVADLLHGIISRKLWFPCKYFTLNAASLTVIAVAMKLPVDLSGSMPGNVDQAAKLGSVAFMCTMMANLLPSLATMNTNELLANIVALVILVVTLVVNVIIQLQTGVISYKEDGHLLKAVAKKYNLGSQGIHQHRNKVIATSYVVLLMVLLAIHVCSSLAILRAKQIIESKYEQRHKQASKEAVQQATDGSLLTVDELKQHVSKYWIMAGSGSPQFIITCFPTTTASGVISALTFVLHAITMSWTVKDMVENKMKDYDSDYKWSTLVILLVQFIGVAVGTLAPLSRCFATSSFKVSFKSIPSHMKVFKVEDYWTQKLDDWKHECLRFAVRIPHGSLRFTFRTRQLKLVVKTLKDIVLDICIVFQERVVIVCKILSLIPSFFMICVLHCLRCFKSSSLGEKTKNSEQSHEMKTKKSEQRQHVLQLENKVEEKKSEQREYVLQLEDEMELAERTLEGLSKSMNRLIKRGEKKQLENVMKLLEKSTQGFQGVKKFDMNNHVPFVLSNVEYQDCWSLPVVTLTTVAVTLSNIEEDEVDSLLESVNEGLEYVTLVEENLNASDDVVSVQKRAKKLWQEVYVSRKWLGDDLQEITKTDQANTSASKVEKTRQIVGLFLGKAKSKFKEGAGGVNTGFPNEDYVYKSICANSMYRITKTILDDDAESQNELFEVLRTRIADIMAACLTNLPQAIAMKCHNSLIEKREACVRAAARLLGETKQIIITLQARNDIPSMNLSDMPYIDKWRAS